VVREPGANRVRCTAPGVESIVIGDLCFTPDTVFISEHLFLRNHFRQVPRLRSN
jgi:hypothetical protein